MGWLLIVNRVAIDSQWGGDGERLEGTRRDEAGKRKGNRKRKRERKGR